MDKESLKFYKLKKVDYRPNMTSKHTYETDLAIGNAPKWLIEGVDRWEINNLKILKKTEDTAYLFRKTDGYLLEFKKTSSNFNFWVFTACVKVTEEHTAKQFIKNLEEGIVDSKFFDAHIYQ